MSLTGNVPSGMQLQFHVEVAFQLPVLAESKLVTGVIVTVWAVLVLLSQLGIPPDSQAT